MRTPLVDGPPEVEFRNGLAYLTYPDEQEPAVVVPIHVLQAFCSDTLRKLRAYEAEISGRVVPLRDHRRKKTPPLRHN